MKINEAKELYSGVFWILDDQDIYNSKDYCFTIPTEPDGTIIDYTGLNAKSGLTYNHEKLWNELPRSLTKGKPFNYYPRGRVQIRNNTAYIYYNPNLDNLPDFKSFIMKQFSLNDHTIKNIKWNPDFSQHYRCHLD